MFRTGFTAAGILFLGILYVIRYGTPSLKDKEIFLPDESLTVKDTAYYGETAECSEESEAAFSVVHVDGEVCSPGVYEIEEGGRVNDAVEAAGGLSEKADLSQINLAMPIYDGMKIHIPGYGETFSSVKTAESAGSGLININTASEKELTELPGIGESKAKAIIRYRQENGAFKSIEELKNVNGIGDGLFSKLCDLITV